MKGSYRIIVSNARLRYDFTIRRNITIVKGNSATGKTTLVGMIREFYESGAQSGIDLKCECQCRALGGRDWSVMLAVMHNCIVFIDENNEFLPTNEFAEAVRQSDNYYVIVTREGLPNLPYSVQEIYGIRESGKYASLKQTYNEFYHIYGRESYTKPVKPEAVIVEDTNSGYEFFEKLPGKGKYSVSAAGGKSKIFEKILAQAGHQVLVIADGAAFGAEADRIIKLAWTMSGIVLYLPESFEWLILKSGVIQGQELNRILEHTEDYVESGQYFSWERFYTSLLRRMTKDSYLMYSKRKLNQAYLQEKAAVKILEVMEGIELQG